VTTIIKRPSRLFSFTDWQKSRPREPVPGDRLDAQFFELIDAIRTTQAALNDLRRDDGLLRNGLVGEEQLLPGLRAQIVGDIASELEPIKHNIVGTASNALESERNAQLSADDALRAVDVARQLASGVGALMTKVQRSADYIITVAATLDTESTDAENWADYAKAQSDNAIAAKNEALQWAEYLAGPIVNAAEAPAYIAGTPFPSGLYYQPVAGGVAGLWSAKWWALQAYNLVGATAFYYLGAWDTPPLPGSTNPATGQPVPNPLAAGSLYYDNTSNTLNVWNGTDWSQPATLTAAFESRFTYVATAGQTVFSGPDENGGSPVVGVSPSSVFVNGVRLADADYTIDAVANSLTIVDPLAAGSIVQWDLLVPAGKLAPGSVNAFKIEPLAPDGTLTDFPLQYIDPNSGLPTDAAVSATPELLLSLDGIVQEPGIDFTATGATLHMAVAPSADAHLWAVWYQPGAPAS
jgi:hypothetical protein